MASRPRSARQTLSRLFQQLRTNGIRLRTVVEGSGPLVVLLHGFPQCWYLWRNQIDAIVEAGFQVAVPDQRGYGGSEKGRFTDLRREQYIEGSGHWVQLESSCGSFE